MNWTTENIPDQSGKTALVTGANSGVGYEIALALYKKGAHVILAARDESKLTEAMDKIAKAGGTGTLEIGVLDLSSLRQVAEFAVKIKDSHTRLDLLVNNAGVMTPPESTTAEGFELQFGVNYLGHFALTGHLYTLLKNTDGARIVTLSSGGHKMVDGIDFDNLRLEKPYDAQREYAVSKLADLLFMAELQRRITLAGDHVISTAAHPGVTESNLARYMDEEQLKAGIEKYGALLPAWQGALPALYAAVAPQVTGNDFYGPDGKYELQGYPAAGEMSAAAKDPATAAKLWKYAEEATGLTFPKL